MGDHDQSKVANGLRSPVPIMLLQNITLAVLCTGIYIGVVCNEHVNVRGHRNE